MNQFYRSELLSACLVFFSVLLLENSVLASGNANVSLVSTNCVNGAWSYSGGTYTWTPSADGSSVDVDDIISIFAGSGTLTGSGITNAATNGAGSVTILTACSGAGTQTGNVTTSAACTAPVSSSTQRTFTITAAGSITLSNAFDFTPSSNASTGYPGPRVVLTGPSGVAVNAALTTTGGVCSGNSAGGQGGNITLTSSGGTVSSSGTITARGAGGGTTSTGAACLGGAGGNITVSGATVNMASALDVRGGNATGTATGGASGTISLTSTSTSVTASNSITLTGGSGGSAGTGAGGAGGSLTISSATSVSLADVNSTGGAGAGINGGGNGGAISVTASGGSITTTNTLTTTGGATGVNGGTGGTGGNITMTASTSITLAAAAITASGGSYSAGSAQGGVGGALSFTANGGSISAGGSITTNGGPSGDTGTGGAAGSLTMTASTSITLSSTVSATGGSGSSSMAQGGAGGAMTLTANNGNINIANTITNNGGAGANSGNNRSGGAGGSISMTAVGSVKIATSATLSTNAGTSYGSGSATAGNISLTGSLGITLNANVTMTTSNGTAGDLTINDGASAVTTGNGANDGQATGYSISGDQFTKTGSGNFKLLGTGNNYTGATTITAGTLTLGIADVLPTTPLIINGGTLSAGYNETVGTLGITDNGVIDLVSTIHTLAFAASNGVSWTAGKMVTIKNWTGGYNGTTATGPIIKTGSSNELDATHKGMLWFKNGASWYAATQISTTVTGEVVPTGTLPVELVSFTAQKNNNQVDVLWKTASEINSDYYDVMRSTDGVDFETINTTDAAGNSNSMLNYFFADLNPKKGTNYYKLIEYDFDGQQQASDVVAVEFSAENIELNAYPNPAINSCTFDFQSENGGIYYLKAFNNVGQEVYAAMVAGIPGTNKFSLDMSSFAIGVYHFQLYDYSKKIATAKVVKE